MWGSHWYCTAQRIVYEPKPGEGQREVPEVLRIKSDVPTSVLLHKNAGPGARTVERWACVRFRAETAPPLQRW